MPVGVKIYNLDEYRKAKKRAMRGLIGVYMYKSHSVGSVVVFMSNNLKVIKKACVFSLKMPYSFILLNKKGRYGYYYLLVYGKMLNRYVALKSNEESWKQCMTLKK